MEIKLTNQGFSLVELLVALGVFTILAAGVLGVVTNSYKNFFGVGDKQVITEYAQEGVEAAKAIAYNSWDGIEAAAGSNHGVVKTGGLWTFSGTSDTLGALTRVVAVANVQRDDDGQIVAADGGNDPQTKKVTVTISGSGIDDYVLETYVMDSNFKTWEQTNWNGTQPRQFWGTATMLSSTYSNIVTSTAGVVKLSGAYNVAFDTPGSFNSSIYDISSNDQELRSVTIGQVIPSGCALQITLQADDDITFGSPTSQIISDTSATTYVEYTSSTDVALNGQRFVRYQVAMTACGASNIYSPALHFFRLSYR